MALMPLVRLVLVVPVVRVLVGVVVPVFRVSFVPHDCPHVR
jgi:hypothetical protein